jgi:hypothetical protein
MRALIVKRRMQKKQLQRQKQRRSAQRKGMIGLLLLRRIRTHQRLRRE